MIAPPQIQTETAIAAYINHRKGVAILPNQTSARSFITHKSNNKNIHKKSGICKPCASVGAAIPSNPSNLQPMYPGIHNIPKTSEAWSIVALRNHTNVIMKKNPVFTVRNPSHKRLRNGKRP